MNRARLTPSPAMVVALIALFVALGGTASALVISGKSIKNGSVTGADLKNRSVGGRDVARDTIGGTNVKEATLGPVKKAKDADTVGGKATGELIAATKASCPPGTIENAGACPERLLRGPKSTYATAIGVCAAAGRRLIGLDQAIALRRTVPGQAATPAELTSELLSFDSVAVVTFSGQPGSGRRTTATAPFRCVAPLKN